MEYEEREREERNTFPYMGRLTEILATHYPETDILNRIEKTRQENLKRMARNPADV